MSCGVKTGLPASPTYGWSIPTFVLAPKAAALYWLALYGSHNAGLSSLVLESSIGLLEAQALRM
ncbi:MAG: hypothetical protein CM15mV57_610 [uncultured marine virus]|nr:MAG: hypothetical protein CM15mV57_610 [uncultured marine virus]